MNNIHANEVLTLNKTFIVSKKVVLYDMIEKTKEAYRNGIAKH